jgi:hypothetical protein
MPPADIRILVAALVQLGAVIFHRRGKRRMRLPGLGQINRALGDGRNSRLVDVERRDLAAQHGIVELARFVAADGIGGDLAERTADRRARRCRRSSRAHAAADILRRPSRG